MLALGLESSDFFINAELLTRARLAGLSVTEVGVSHFPRVRGESKVSILHIIPVLVTLIRFWWSKVLFSAPDSKVKIPLEEPCPLGRGHPPRRRLDADARSEPVLSADRSRRKPVRRNLARNARIRRLRGADPIWEAVSRQTAAIVLADRGEFPCLWRIGIVGPVGAGIAAMLTVVATYALGARLISYTAAWLGGLSMLSCFGFLISGRFVFIDTLLMLFTTVGLLTGYLAGRGQKFNVWWWIASAVACALGVLAKGPITVILCLPPLLAHRWLSGLPALRLRDWGLYAAIGAGITLPWFLLVNARQENFLIDFLWTHHVNRFVSGLSHTEPWWYYIPVILIGMLPCSLLFPAAIAFLADRGVTTRPWRTRDVGFLVLASAWTFVFFSGSSCKLPPYLLPAVPIICLVVGRALESILSGQVETPFLTFVRRQSPQHLKLIFVSTAVICAAIDASLLNGVAAGHLTHWLVLIGAGTVVATASALGLFNRGRLPWATTGVMAVVSMGFAMQDFYPGVATMRSKVNPVVDLCQAEIDRATPVVCFSLAHEADSLVFHLGTERVRSFDADELGKVIRALNDGPEVIVVANENSIDSLRSQLPQSLKLAELGHYEHIYVGICTVSPDIAARR